MRAARASPLTLRTLLLTVALTLVAPCGALRGGFFQRMLGGDAADVRTFFAEHFERRPLLKRLRDRCALWAVSEPKP
jgi:hypothetical protein